MLYYEVGCSLLEEARFTTAIQIAPPINRQADTRWKIA